MRTPLKLSLYSAGLVVLFVAAYSTAQAIVPASVSATWQASDATSEMKGHTGNTKTHSDETSPTVGVSLEQDGFLLGPITAPTRVGDKGELSFQLSGPDQKPLTGYEKSHEKDLHLIVVRSDGSEFHHVHPNTNGQGGWSIPWQWNKAGTYRVFADFLPTQSGKQVTLTRTVEVPGAVESVLTHQDTTSTEIDGFQVTVKGNLTTHTDSMLSFNISKSGEPVRALQPYLGAFGHLVALREGDLAYLHAHPTSQASSNALSGPEITFMTEVPTPGTYLLYLEFQIAGVAHTAPLVLTAA